MTPTNPHPHDTQAKDAGGESRQSRSSEPVRQGELAWSDQDLRNPHRQPDKAARVRAMFDAISDSYDLNNRVHSFGLDQAWRAAAVRSAAVAPGEIVADIAAGTGDLALAFSKTPAKKIYGIDFAANMLAKAHDKTPADLNDRVYWVVGDALNLPLADASIDVVSIAFGIRNVSVVEGALSEFRRVLRPGGRLIILEFAKPQFAPIRWASHFYTDIIMPRTATWLAKDRTRAYRYLPESVRSFLTPDELSKLIREAGFISTVHRPLSGGIVHLHTAHL